MATSTNFPTTDEALTRAADQGTEQVRQLADRVVSGAHAVADKTVERVAPVIERLKSTASEAGQKLQARAEDLVSMQGRLAEESRETVRQHPLTWVAAAFAVGLMIGHLGRD